MCSLLKYKRQTNEDLIKFTVRLFDPVMSGFTPVAKFEEMIELMFEVDDQIDGNDPKKKAP